MTCCVDRYRCFLVGSESLLIECGETLLRQGHEILGVVTAAKKIRKWATSKGLRLIDAAGDYRAVLAEQPFDYLFSITYLSIIPEEVLALPTRGAVNFHDGPLPRYAGLNTPVWALLNHETDYAVTWHWMTPGVDCGDILVQKPVEIAANDTALTLNTKCFHAGMESFAELIGLLSTGTISPRPQNLAERKYFAKHDRPVAAGALDFAKSAGECETLIRALNHGRYVNPVSTAKVRLGGKTFVVVEATVGDGEATAQPGTIVDVAADAISVACGDGVLQLRGFSTTCGKPIAPGDFASLHGLHVGNAFDALTLEETVGLTELNRLLAKHEAWWVRRLESLDAAQVPYVAVDGQAVPPNFAEARQNIPSAFVERFGSRAAEALLCSFAAYLARVGEKTAFDVAFADEALHRALAGLPGWAAAQVPLRFDVDTSVAIDESLTRHAAEFAAVRKRLTYLHDALGRYPELHDRSELAAGRALPIAVEMRTDVDAFAPRAGALLQFAASIEQGVIRWAYDASAVSSAAFATIRSQFANFLAAVAASPELPQAEIELLTPAEKKLILHDWNAVAADYRRDACVHQLFEEQAARTPDAVAVAFEDRQLTYRELNDRADRLAVRLRSLGVGPDRLVGIHLERSENLVIAVLATLKAGGAYLPLDPNYPEDRIAFMVEDAAAPVIITENETRDRLPPHQAAVVTIDAHHAAVANSHSKNEPNQVAPHNLAYVIYTSGSTGKPKGVMIEHRNAVNFFAGMDQRLDVDPAGTWLAVTSLSFDIHVLELLWTLTRGFKVVVYRDRNLLPSGEGARRTDEGRSSEARLNSTATSSHPGPVPKGEGGKPLDFSLFYFSADSEAETADKYRLLLEGAKWGDAHGFCAVWTPERHFHSFGGLYPNPAVTGAAVAVITKHAQVRAGSVVLPLHHPLRVAEAWQMVDNLSNGRVGIAFAAGWQPTDFVLMPQNYADAKNVMFRDIETVKRLWRGEKLEFPGATGKPVAVETLPRPIQKELPVWVTTAGNIDTYVAAGRIGANVLTHLLGQSVEELAPKIAAYREARAAAGFDPATGIVSLMLHTFVGTDADEVRETVRGPLKAYLGTSLNLLKHYAWVFPAFKRPKNGDTAGGNEFETLTAEEQDALLEFAFERYYETSGLFGTPDDALRTTERVRSIGVDEIACLIDFGVSTDTVLNHLPYLNEVREKANAPLAASLATRAEPESAGQAPRLNEDYSLAALFARHNVTHFQCTPSLARMLLSDEAGRAAVRGVKNFLVGGEALPVDLARDLKTYVGGRVINMYGPTETTVWSTSHVVDDVSGAIPIGRPLANQQVYVLDRHRKPVPAGVPGELYIAGDGVTRGYLNRPELTADRFVHDPFSARPQARMYRTGDLVRHRGDGVVEFLGRTDHQVKIRGHRIELGEIEARLTEHPHVRQCVVVPREVAPGDVRLAAFYVPDGTATPEADLRAFVRAKLPEYMAPQHLVALDALPLTPNGKIDRKALPPLDLAASSAPAADYVAPTNDLERTIAELWQSVLGREQVGVDDNFFDLGGHSLLVVRMHRQLTQAVSLPVALTDLFRFPTIRTLVAHLSGANQGEAAQEGTDRAAKRRELQQRRRIVKR